MAIDSLSVWRQEFANLPKVDNPIWSINFANWYFNRVSAVGAADSQGLFPDPADLAPTGWLFTFDIATFISLLTIIPPSLDQVASILLFADAWLAAMQNSPVVVASGTFKPPPSNATTFSTVNNTSLDPPSIIAGKTKLLELQSVPQTDDALQSQFPVIFREATLLLTFTVEGLDSTTNNNPLTVPNVGVV